MVGAGGASIRWCGVANSCLCEMCSPGASAFSYSERFRHESEARSVLRMAFPARRPHLAGVERARGKAGADRLRDEVSKQHGNPKKTTGE